MKLLIVLLLISGSVFGQSTYFIRADSVRLQKVGGNTTLIIENGTRTKTGAYLRNYSNGRTDFNYAVDSGSVSGSNLILWRGGGTQNVTIGIPVGSITTKGFETASLSGGVLNIPKDQRVGTYLEMGKTFTRSKPFVFGSVLLGLGNSYVSGAFSDGTPYMTQLGTFYGKTVYTGAAVLGGDLNTLVQTSYAFGTFGNDTATFVDLSVSPAFGYTTAGQPLFGTFFYNDHPNSPEYTKTKNYNYGTWRAFIANHYLDNDWFSVSSLADANYRDGVASDSLGPKSSVGSRGLGAFQFTKPAGKTSIVIGTYGSDGTRVTQGTVTVALGATTYFSQSLNGQNDANRGNALVIKAGLNYYAIVLQNLPLEAATVTVTASVDSTYFDYIGYLKPKETAVRPLYISNIGYQQWTLVTIANSAIDTANWALQDAVNDFIDYPVYIQNTNNWASNPTTVNASGHFTAAGNDSVANAYKRNLIPQGYAPTNNSSIGRRFGVSGEDATAAQHRTFTTSGFDFQLYGENGTKQQLIRTLADSTLGMYLRNSSSADLAYFILDGSDTSANIKAGRQTHGSAIHISDAGTNFTPYLGLVNIDSLNYTLSAVGKKIMIRDTATGAVWNIDPSLIGGGGSPAGNFGNLQINRNGAFAVAGSDSLDFESATGLSVKGIVNVNSASAYANHVLRVKSFDDTYNHGIVVQANNGSTELEIGYGGFSRAGAIFITTGSAAGIIANERLSIATNATALSTLQVNGSVQFAYTAQTATYPITANDYAINCTANTFTTTLPTAVGIAGRMYFITNSGAGTITLATTSSQTFANVVATPTTLTLATLTGVVVMSDGANWLKVSSF